MRKTAASIVVIVENRKREWYHSRSRRKGGGLEVLCSRNEALGAGGGVSSSLLAREYSVDAVSMSVSSSLLGEVLDDFPGLV